MENEKKPLDVVPGHMDWSPDYKSEPPRQAPLRVAAIYASAIAAAPKVVVTHQACRPDEEQLAAARAWLMSPGAEAVDDWNDPDAVAPSLAALLAGRERGLVQEIVEFVASAAEDWEPGRIAREIEARWGRR